LKLKRRYEREVRVLSENPNAALSSLSKQLEELGQLDEAMSAALLVIRRRLEGGYMPIRDAAKLFRVKPWRVVEALSWLKKQGLYVKPKPEGVVSYLLNRMFILRDERELLMKEALSILEKVSGSTSRDPLGLAAAAIAIASENHKMRLSRGFIAKAAGLSESAVRSAKRFIERKLSSPKDVEDA